MTEQLYWRFYRLARLQCAYAKQPAPAQIAQDTISCTRSEMELVSSSYIMFRIKTKGHDGFFSLIYRHTDLHAYLERVINDYYDFVCTEPDRAENDRALMLKTIADPERRARFYRMGNVWTADSPVLRFLKTGDPAQIGLACDASDPALIERLKVFVRKYAWCAVAAYKQADQSRKDTWQTASANRALATQSLAELLGISYMIPKAEYSWLEIDGKHRCFGLFTERAPGEDITQIPPQRREAILSPVLQRELNRLHMLDVLCTEKDHCPENYHVIVENGQVVGISVFDNNAGETFSIRRSVSFETYIRCVPLIDEQGTLDRPCFDAELADRIRRLSERDIRLALAPYLSSLPIRMLCARISRLNKAIAKSLQEGSTEAVGNDAWTPETLRRELQWPHGKTYLHSFLRDCVHI